MWPLRHPGVHCCFSAPFDTHTCNHWSRRHPLCPCTHTPRRVAVLAHLLAGFLNTSSLRNCWWIQYSFAIAQLEKRPLQSAGEHCLHHQPEVPFSHCTCSCSEQQQVITCKSVTKERVWECRWKRKEPETRASGHVEEDPLRVDKHVNT